MKGCVYLEKKNRYKTITIRSQPSINSRAMTAPNSILVQPVKASKQYTMNMIIRDVHSKKILTPLPQLILPHKKCTTFTK